MRRVLGICITLLLLCILPNRSYAADYYWVGDGGDWSDFANHWATSSGGVVFHGQAPTTTDNVFFDANSFSVSGDTVFVDIATATCQNMDWTGTSQDVFLDGGDFNDLEVYGNCTLDNALVWIFKGRLNFKNLGNVQFTPLNVTLKGALAINGGGTVYLENDLDADTAIDISFGILSAENLAATQTYDIECGGGFSMFGNFLPSTGKVTMNGDGMQMIMGGGPVPFYDLEIDNSAGGAGFGVQCSGQVDVSNQLIFANGILTAFPGNEVKLLPGATIVGASSSRYVSGPLRRVGNTDFTFPVGGGGKYQPVTLSNLTGPPTDEFTCEYLSYGHWDLSTLNAPLNNVSTQEYFEISRFGSSNADVTVSWADKDVSGIDDASDLSIVHFNGASWDKLGQSSITFTPAGDITINGVSTFSPFTFGSDSPVLNSLTLNDTLRVGASEVYTTIQAAYDAIPTPMDKEYWILVQGDYDDSGEFVPVFFNVKSGGYKINIMPDVGVSGTELIGSPGGFDQPIVEFGGCSNVILDGRPGGVGSEDWLIRNTTTGANAGPAIVFSNDADSNSVKYLDLEAEPGPTSTRPAIVYFDLPFIAGCDFDSIIGCKIHDLTVGGTVTVPFAGIYSQGSVGVDNDNNVISGCEIYDCIGMGSGHPQTAALYLDPSNSNWSVTDNHFFQTTALANVSKMAGFIHIDEGEGYLISGNSFGGQGPNAGGGAFAINAGIEPFMCIHLGFNMNGDSSNVLNNTIANFSVTMASNNAMFPAFSGIVNEADSRITIGAAGMGNTIGSMGSVGSINITDNNGLNNRSFTGIWNGATDTCYISNNSIGGITLGGTVSNSDSYGILHSGNSGVLVNGNTIGGSIVNSIQVNSDIRYSAIANNSFSGETFHVTNNTIQRIDFNATNWDLYGILNETDSLVCENNTFQNWDVSSDSGYTAIGHYDFSRGAMIIDNSFEDLISTNTGNGSGIFLVDVECDIAVAINGNTFGGETVANISGAGNDNSFGISAVGLGAFGISGNTFQNFDLSSGSSSNRLYVIYGESGTFEITDNTIKDLRYAGSSSFESMTAIYLASDALDLIIAENVITDIVMSSSSGPDFTGILIESSIGGGWTAQVAENIIKDISASSASSSGLIQAVYWNDGDIDCFNNVILLDNGGATNSLTIIGFYQDFAAGGGQNLIYHNTVVVDGSPSAGSSPSSAIRLDDNNDVEILNNIFKNTRSGGSGDHICIESVNSGSFASDYNFFENPAGNPFIWNGTTRSFAQWQSQSGGDNNSILSTETIDTLGYATASFAGADLGTNVLVEVAFDLEGNARDASPWMGAYEGEYIAPMYYPNVAGGGLAIELDADDFIELATPITTNINDLTFEMWFMWDGTITGSDQMLMMNGNNGASGMGLYLSSASREISGRLGGLGAWGSGVDAVANKWTHVALVGSLGNQWQIYVDGVASGAPFGGAANTPTNKFTIGANHVSAFDFNGSVDEIRVWSKELPEAMIRDWMCRKITGAHPEHANLSNHFVADTGSGTTLYDYEGGKHMTFAGSNPFGQWVTSGAAMGDSAIYTFGAGPLTYNGATSMTVENFSAGVDGMFIYYVDDTAATSTFPAGITGPDSIGFFGVFKSGTNASTYDVTYDYSGDPNVNGQGNEGQVRLLKRSGPSDTSWELASGFIQTNTKGNKITLPSQTGTEYVTGFSNATYPDRPGAGYTLDLDGSNDYINMGDPADGSLDFVGDMTFACWFRREPGGASNGRLLAKGCTSGGVAGFAALASTSQLEILFGDGSVRRSLFADITTNNWYHLAATRSGTSVNLYVNGVLEHSRNDFTTNSMATNLNFVIGRDPSVGVYWSGDIDELTLWQRELTQDEVKDLMCQKVNGTHPHIADLRAYYRFDTEEMQDSIFDLVGTNHGAMTSMDPNTDWELSGAYVGDSSIHTYSGTADLVLASPNFGTMRVQNLDGDADSLHLYYVADTTHDLTPPVGIDSLDKVGYWGIFDAGKGSGEPYRNWRLDYAAHPDIPGHVNEGDMTLAGRGSNDNSWITFSSPQDLFNYAPDDSLVVDSLNGSFEVVAAFAPSTSPGPNYYVNDGAVGGDVYTGAIGADVANCGTPGMPCATVGYVLTNYALSYDTIFVDAGIYTEGNLTIADDTIVLKGLDSSLTVFDGSGLGAGSHCFDVDAPDQVFEDITVLSYDNGGGTGGGFVVNGFDGVLELNRVRVQGCAGSSGGGVSVVHSTAGAGELRLEECSFVDNTSNSTQGGGVVVFRVAGNFSAYIEDCVFGESGMPNTSSSEGGGLYFQGDTLEVTGSTFIENVGTTNGGGISIGAGQSYFYECYFEGNNTPGSGGGIYHATGANIDIDSCFFQSNSASQDGGALFVNTAEVQMNGDTLFGNSSTDDGGAIYMNTGSDLYATNLVFGESGQANTADQGGALDFHGDTLEMAGGEFAYNTASSTGDGGGAVRIASGTDTATFVNVSFDNNQAIGVGGDGGAFSQTTGELVLDNCVLSNNNANDNGGGIYCWATSYLTVQNGTQIGSPGQSNTAQDGGGIYFDGNELHVDSTQISYNTSTADGAGIMLATGEAWVSNYSLFEGNLATDDGGAIWVNNGRNLWVTGNSEFGRPATGNQADEGGAIYFLGDTLQLDSTTLRDNLGNLFQYLLYHLS